MSVYDDEKSDNQNKLIPGDKEGSAAKDIAKREGAFSSSLGQGNNQSKTSNPNELKKAEGGIGGVGVSKSGSGGLYNATGSGGLAKKLKGTFWGSRRRKQASIGGGFMGLILGGGIIGLTFIGGTGFEFVHMAELLEHSHLSDQQDASDEEMGKLYRYLNNGGDIGETRLTFLESKYKNTMLEQLDDIGLKPKFNSSGVYDNFDIDTTNPDSPYYGMDKDQVKARLAENGITDGISTTDLGEGKFNVAVDPELSFLQSYSTKKLTLKLMVSDMDEASVPDAIRWRILAKYGFVTWHPLESLKNNIDGTVNKALLAAWEAAKNKFLTTGDEPAVDLVPGDANEDDTAADTNESSIKNTLEAIKGSTAVKVAGGTALAIGLVCTTRYVADNISDIKYAQDILPMMRLGSEVVTTGNQVMNGGDVDPNEMNVLAQQFTNSSGQSWSDSQTFEADSGEPMTGQDIDLGVKQTLSNTVPGYLNWVNAPGVSTVLSGVCTGVGSVLSGVVGIGVGIASGDFASTVLGLVAGQLSTPYIKDLAKTLAGTAVDVVHASGPTFGNYVNYGVRYFANAGAVQDGGVALTSTQTTELNNEQALANAKTVSSESIADRILNPDIDTSLVSRVMDSQTSSLSQNVDNIATDLINLGSLIISSPVKLIFSIAHADSTTNDANNYDYPFPQYGFSSEDLNAMSNVNPYTNAENMVPLLEDSGQPGYPNYKAEAKSCFNVTIFKDSQGLWDVSPGASSSPDALNLYTPTYTRQDCDHPPGFPAQSWLDMRFFIFDTGVMEGYACEQGDDQSCTNDGFNTSSSSSSSTSGGISIDTQAAQQVIQQDSSNGVNVGYALYDSSGDLLASDNDTFENYGASITKSMILVAYLNQIGSGTISAQAQSELTNMIENSDDASANWVYGQLTNGPSEINEVATEAGMTGFKLDTSDPLYVLGQSQITAADFANFFSKINTYITPSQEDFGMNLLANLSATDQVGLLQSGLPGVVYSKEGWKPEPAGTEGAPYIVNQAAQFSESGITYGIAVTVGGTATQTSGEAAVQQVVSALIGSSSSSN